jgi:hypothetical protein
MPTFTKKLVDLIQPQTVVFSLRRGGNNNPQPEIVRTVRENIPDARIACTQLSKRCAAALPANQPTHLAAKYAQGRQSDRCCGGTFVINLNEAARPFLPVMQAHADFISVNAETALCQTPLNARNP